DVLAMLPGDHVVVVGSKSTDFGAALLDGRVHVVYDHDGDKPYDIMLRMQRANALDVVAVLALVDPAWGK
ncbi:hypothetical protein, partial [Gemmatimonas sp.]|uniref:hypothetical protein n=1 Tax=Gemmatimonas sp. TaxID=1962908 RepID=UPI003567F4E7